MNKVYIVIGRIYGEDSCETVVSQYSVYSTPEKARQELYRVLQETVEDAKKNNIEFNSEMTETKLSIDWIETGAEEYWEIYEREIDKEVK